MCIACASSADVGALSLWFPFAASPARSLTLSKRRFRQLFTDRAPERRKDEDWGFPLRTTCRSTAMSGREQREEFDDELAPLSRVLDRTSSIVRYSDGEGRFWSVREKDASRTPGARQSRCLIFDSADAIRRVWIYPANWRLLSADGLIALSWTR